MTPHPICDSPLPGSCIRVVYRVGAFELFAIGILNRSAEDHLVMEQHSDQYGPVGPFRLTIPCSSIIRLSESERPPQTPHCHAE